MVVREKKLTIFWLLFSDAFRLSRLLVLPGLPLRDLAVGLLLVTAEV